MSSNTNKIFIVGCGLLGSMLAAPLSAFAVSLDVGIGVTLVDYDKIEKRNSPSDLGVPSTIGKKKVDVVAEIYERAGIDVVKQPVRLTYKNIWLVKGHSLLVGATDNVEARQILLKAAQHYDIPYIDLGLSGVSGNVTWSYRDVVTMPFAGVGEDYQIIDNKQPACELVGTRVFSSIVTECAAISIFVYTSGHDPTGIVFQAIERIAENGDMVNWYVTMGDSRISAVSKFVSAKEVADGSDSEDSSGSG